MIKDRWTYEEIQEFSDMDLCTYIIIRMYPTFQKIYFSSLKERKSFPFLMELGMLMDEAKKRGIEVKYANITYVEGRS